MKSDSLAYQIPNSFSLFMLLPSHIIVISDLGDGPEISKVVQVRSEKEKMYFELSPSMYVCVCLRAHAHANARTRVFNGLAS